MVMSRYVERQLNHQRHLLSLELPVMMQNRSEGLNERLKRILGMDNTQEASVEWSRGNRSDDGEDNDELEGSAGDLASRPYSKFETNAHIEVVDALPSPACDSVNFAVILHLPLFSLSLFPFISLLDPDLLQTTLHTHQVSLHDQCAPRGSGVE